MKRSNQETQNNSLKQFNIETVMGEVRGGDMPFLTKEELTEFNKIGYSGKDSKGRKTNFEQYLNSLDKGIFSVQKTKTDSGDFCEAYQIAWYEPEKFGGRNIFEMTKDEAAHIAMIVFGTTDRLYLKTKSSFAEIRIQDEAQILQIQDNGQIALMKKFDDEFYHPIPNCVQVTKYLLAQGFFVA